MTRLERLRLAGALAHSVHGAELRLRTDRDEVIVVSHHPAADLDPCALRQVIATSAFPGNTDYSERIVDIDVGGALTDLGGGIHATISAGRAQCWIVTLLHPDRLAQLLDAFDLRDVDEEVMHVAVRPDSSLDVTSLVLTSNDARFDRAIDEVAVRAAALCFVEELRSATWSPTVDDR